jgi:hypothetical protein
MHTTYINEIDATDWTSGVQFFPAAEIIFSAGNVCRVASQATGPEHQRVNDLPCRVYLSPSGAEIKHI